MRRDSATPHLKPITAQQMLDAGLDVRANLAMRPQRTPQQVLGMWMENIGAGAGIGAIPAGALYLAGAPLELWSGAWLIAGVCAGGWLMWQRGSIDERAMRRSERMIDKAFATQAADYEAQLSAVQVELDGVHVEWQRRESVYLDALDQADGEIAQLQRAADAMTRARDNAVYDLAREREQATQRNGRATFVPPVELTPQELSDATEMIRHRYMFGAHLSRRKAADAKRWTQPRWEAAAAVLVDARVTRVINGVTEYPQGLDEALQQFGEYMIHARQLSAPAANRALGVNLYVESDEG